MLKVALELEKIALSDQYFIDRKLYPNVDFYSGITLKAMGFPTSMFTVLFAVARTVGWISQWSEMIEDPQQKIGRPRQLYTGVGQAATTCRSTSASKQRHQGIRSGAIARWRRFSFAGALIVAAAHNKKFGLPVCASLDSRRRFARKFLH